MKKKRGQEEIVGFVLIMIIVAVILLVFLGITIRNDFGSARSESSEVYQFLESSMEYTTTCAFNSAPDYFILGELFEECYVGNNCLNERNACEVLSETLSQVFDGAWNVGFEGNIKGYEFRSFYGINSTDSEEEIISLFKGSCNGSINGATYLTPAFPGRIESELVVCY